MSTNVLVYSIAHGRSIAGQQLSPVPLSLIYIESDAG